MINNILSIYYQATTQEITAGSVWYKKAYYAARAISDNTGISLEQVCCVISALSPRNKWERNLQDAQNICEAFAIDGELGALSVTVATFHANRQRAVDFLTGAKSEDDLLKNDTSRKSGWKTAAFAQSIYSAGDTELVTVDVHATSIYRAIRQTKATEIYNLTPKRYQAISKAYCDAAKRVGISPAAMQAITWLVWKRLHNI